MGLVVGEEAREGVAFFHWAPAECDPEKAKGQWVWGVVVDVCFGAAG